MRYLVFLILVCSACQAFSATVGAATWFSYESARREGTSGIMANGAKLDGKVLGCALPWSPDGRRYRIMSYSTKKSIVVAHTDRGPGRTAIGRGVVVDLTRAAYLALGGDLERGRMLVRVDAVKQKRK